MSVRPSTFLYAKNTQNLRETEPPVPVFTSMASNQLLSPAERAVADPSNSDTGVCVCVWGGCVCARVCVHPFVRDVFAIYDNNI